MDAVEVDDIESGLLVTPALAKAAFRIPLRRFSMKPELRSQHVVPRGVAQVLASREAPATTAEGKCQDYLSSIRFHIYRPLAVELYVFIRP